VVAGSSEVGDIFERDGLFSAACATIFRRVGGRPGVRLPADAGAVRGLSKLLP
jgi:hypothetical protein